MHISKPLIFSKPSLCFNTYTNVYNMYMWVWVFKTKNSCTSTLIRKLFGQEKFTTDRTKTREVAVNMIAPFAV